MSGLQLAIAHAVTLALVAALLGVLVRGRLRQCWTFPVYLMATLIGNSLVSLWPDWYTPTVWIVKQSVYDLLKMAVALELAYRALRAFPGAWRTARVVLLLLLVLSSVVLAAVTPRSSYVTVWEWQPSVVTAAVWLLTATALLVVWYHLPVHDWQRAIMLGLAPYLLVFVTLLDLLGRWGWEFRAAVGVVGSLAYLAVVLFWTHAAWRPASGVDRQGVLQRLLKARAEGIAAGVTAARR